jgi:hypothetical protein
VEVQKDIARRWDDMAMEAVECAIKNGYASSHMISDGWSIRREGKDFKLRTSTSFFGNDYH